MRGGATRFKKGTVPWNKTEGIHKTCPKCGTQFRVKPSGAHIVHCSMICASVGKPSPMEGRKHSAETRLKQRKAKLGIRGPEHWNWRGGKRSERSRAMARDEYIQWRKAVFERDNYTCQSCGERGGKLHVDHILPWAKHPERRFDVANGRTLCVPCHYKTPTFPKQLIPKELRNG